MSFRLFSYAQNIGPQPSELRTCASPGFFNSSSRRSLYLFSEMSCHNSVVASLSVLPFGFVIKGSEQMSWYKEFAMRRRWGDLFISSPPPPGNAMRFLFGRRECVPQQCNVLVIPRIAVGQRGTVRNPGNLVPVIPPRYDTSVFRCIFLEPQVASRPS
jgi:hypothetical protein